MTSDHRTSLRGLARRLGCTHGALSKAIHLGRLTAGVHVDGHGRIVVVDSGAAESQWRDVHLPTIAEVIRRELLPPPPRPPGPLDAELYDRHYDRWITGAELLAERDQLALLNAALAAMAIDLTEVGEIRDVTAGQLRRLAALHDASAATITGAEQELASILEMLIADAIESSTTEPTP